MGKRFLTLLLPLLILTGCGRKVRTDAYPGDVSPSTGAVLEVVAVVDSSLYSERTRAALYRYLSPVKPGQPQRERQTKLYIIPRSSFSHTYRTMRNLVLVERSDSLSGLTTARNVYSAPQNVFTLRASDERQAVEQIAQSGDYIFQAIRQTAIDALQDRFARITNTRLKAVSALGIDIRIPNYYHVAVAEKDFVWLTMDISKRGIKGTANLLLYTADTKALGTSDPVALRDSLSRRYVPGQIDSSYMAVEKIAIRPQKENARLGDIPVVFTYGYWRVVRDYMGGSFINYCAIDPDTGIAYCADGFVYLPFEEKESFMLELEAILRTFRPTALSEKKTER